MDPVEAWPDTSAGAAAPLKCPRRLASGGGGEARAEHLADAAEDAFELRSRQRFVGEERPRGLVEEGAVRRQNRARALELRLDNATHRDVDLARGSSL